MIILVLGGSGSGKSAFAEDVATSLSDKLLYVATMQPFGQEALARISRHVGMRKDKGFESVDCYTDLADLDCQGYGAILLECMSNLLANEQYAQHADCDFVVEKILDGVAAIKRRTKNLVIVSNDIGFDINAYSGETLDYIQKLGEINCRLAKQAEVVIEIVSGIPLYHKGEKTW